MPSGPVLTAVAAACNPKTVRPMSDKVTAIAATPVDYALTVSVVLKKGTKSEDAMPLVEQAAADYVAERAGGLGRSLVLSQITKALSTEDVYSVTIASPVATTITPLQWARCTAVTVTFTGYATGD